MTTKKRDLLIALAASAIEIKDGKIRKSDAEAFLAQGGAAAASIDEKRRKEWDETADIALGELFYSILNNYADDKNYFTEEQIGYFLTSLKSKLARYTTRRISENYF